MTVVNAFITSVLGMETTPETIALVTRLLKGLEECDVPMGLREGLVAYIVQGRPTGHFLEAVLSNNLREACQRADDHNKYRLFDVVKFLYNHAPLTSWGSEEHVTDWKRQHAERRAHADLERADG